MGAQCHGLRYVLCKPDRVDNVDTLALRRAVV